MADANGAAPRGHLCHSHHGFNKRKGDADEIASALDILPLVPTAGAAVIRYAKIQPASSRADARRNVKVGKGEQTNFKR